MMPGPQKPAWNTGFSETVNLSIPKVIFSMTRKPFVPVAGILFNGMDIRMK
jgi:hypothetical protein